ncbi:MAG: hypothetical protein Q9163_000299 [Psora crenata]
MSGTASRPSVSEERGDRSSSKLAFSGQHDALKSRTPSELNTPPRQAPNRKAKSGSSAPSAKHRQKEHDSLSSRSPVLQSTVQHKASPHKGQARQVTPQWKKRIIKGEAGKDNQTDLFSPSPVGLEGVFKPPTIGPRSPQKGITKKSASVVEDGIPSQSNRPAKTVQQKIPSNKDRAPNGVNLPENDSQSRPSSPKPDNIPNRHEVSVNLSVSDQSKSANFSPVYVSKHNTADGRIGFTAIDRSMQRLLSNIDGLRLHKQGRSRSSSGSTDKNVSRRNAPASEDFMLRKQMDEIASHLLPDDLSTGTDAYAANGGFVNTQRGGRSDEGSFYKRTLSPSSPLPQLDRYSTKPPSPQGKTVSIEQPISLKSQKEPFSPRTPQKDLQGTQGSPERPQSSGSPLKLFDKYDTFTNDRLIRRMSKFEETFEQKAHATSGTGDDDRPASPSPGMKASRQRRCWRRGPQYAKESTISSFGDGELDGYSFPNPGDCEPTLPQLPTYQPDDVNTAISMRRRLKHRSFHSFESIEQPHPAQQIPAANAEYDISLPATPPHQNPVHERPKDQSDVHRTMHGKRARLSPGKDAASKRRRTIRSSEERQVAKRGAIHPKVELNEPTPKPLVGRKRKDALYDKQQQAADPSVLAMRHMRRPRNPTPNQASSFARNIPVKPTGPTSDAFSRFSEVAGVKIDPPTQIVAGALATVALNTAQDITCGSRKASVTTADFFNEAQQIMRLIRAEKRPRSSHATANASQLEPQTIYEESIVLESTRDDFSRPPSREGVSLGKLRAPTQLDARVVSHLRKFEDKDDLGLILSSSLKSLKMSRSRTTSDASIVHQTRPTSGGSLESDPPNIRIFDRQLDRQQQEPSLSSHGHKSHDDHPDNNMNSSCDSTGRSMPTGSSGSSGNRMVIAPETVAHLLSDQMAGMVFDRKKQMWIKRKSSVDTEGFDVLDGAASEGTEEDLFGDIPDLTVDEMEELRRVQEAVSAVNTMGSTTDQFARQEHATGHSLSAQALVTGHEEGRPKTAEGKSIHPGEQSSAPSKYSHIASSGLATSTRATSWGDEYNPQQPRARQVPSLAAVGEDAAQDCAEDVEHEISIFDDRVADPLIHQDGRPHQARVVTVAFSSPLVDHVQSPDPQRSWNCDDQPWLDGTPSRYSSQRPNSRVRRTSAGTSRRSVHYDASRRVSLTSQSYIARPLSRLEEHEELSIVQYSVNGNRTMDIAISTPLPLSRSLLEPPTTGRRSSIDFHLSPLPDFTVHQIDGPLEAHPGTLAKLKEKSLTEAGYTLSLTAQNLVKHLTDLEPYEPYWEYTRSVDLHDRGLTSLHMLDEFCTQAEELDVSCNKIGELNGIPSTVRFLNVSANCLSDLTAWHHLKHLQYLDVSGNSLTTLKALQRLVHLRALKADDNIIDSLDGTENLNGLLSLRLRNNRLRIVDFKHYDLRRLTDLDVAGNGVVRMSNIERLPALKSLNLRDNGLEAFSLCSRLRSLETLNLADNKLKSIDVCAMPALRILIIDRNAIRRVDSLKWIGNLQLFSWREQRCEPGLEYQSCQEAHSLCFSSNVLTTFGPPTPFLNLRVLELASTGLQTLRADFGSKCPNLRMANFNYNALSNLEPLLGIAKLERLYLAGNRISRLRRTTAVLNALGKELVEVDLRNNPLTVGFYTPQDCIYVERRMVVQDRGRVMAELDDEYVSEGTKAYLLPPLDKDADNASRQRLDEDTKLRRRVYEMLTINACKNLERLDGLGVGRKAVGQKDGVWDRLVELGVLKAKQAGYEVKCGHIA